MLLMETTSAQEAHKNDKGAASKSKQVNKSSSRRVRSQDAAADGLCDRTRRLVVPGDKKVAAMFVRRGDELMEAAARSKLRP